jgi:hypothetical protein
VLAQGGKSTPAPFPKNRKGCGTLDGSAVETSTTEHQGCSTRLGPQFCAARPMLSTRCAVLNRLAETGSAYSQYAENANTEFR